MGSSEAPKPQRTRETILDRAFDCFQESGYTKTSMEDVAHAAGVSRAALYLHFQSKHEMALAMIEHNADRVYAELGEIARGKGPSKKRLEMMMRHRIMWRFDRCRIAACSLDELFAAIRQPFLHLRQRLGQREAELIAELLIEGRLTGEFQFDDAFRTAESFVLATNSLMPFALSTHELGDRVELEQKLERLIALCLRSISSQPTTRPAKALHSSTAFVKS